MQTSPFYDFFITEDFAKVPSTASKLRIKSTATTVPVLFFQSTDDNGTGTKKVPRYCLPIHFEVVQLRLQIKTWFGQIVYCVSIKNFFKMKILLGGA